MFPNNVPLTPKRLDHLSIIFKMTNKGMSKIISENIMREYYGACSVIANPMILSNAEALAEYDKYHIALYEADEYSFSLKPRWLMPYIKYAFSCSH